LKQATVTFCDPIMHRFHRAQGCNGQTDGQTPRRWLRRGKHYMLLRAKTLWIKRKHAACCDR